MKHTPELIVMLTHNDVTVPDAAAVFARCQHTHARYWGFKEEGLPFAEMQALFAQMKACGKTTCLEVIAYTEPECLHGAEMGKIFIGSDDSVKNPPIVFLKPQINLMC